MSDLSAFDLSDKQRLELTLRTRENIITQMTVKGLPESKEDRAFLLSALDGMDRTVLTRARIKTDEAANQTNQNTVNIIAGLLAKVSPASLVGEAKERELPALDGTFTVTPVEGETVIGVQQLSYETFIASFETP